MNKTNFHIDENDSIAEIKSRFSVTCPNYGIDFFTGDDEPHSLNACAMYCPQVRISEINHQFRNGSIRINDQMEIEEIEHLIHDRFKLHVQISSIIPGKRTRFVPTLPDFLKEKSHDRMRLPARSGVGHF